MKLMSEDGWQLLTIQPNDNLELVKSPFARLLTPEVRRVFAAAPKHFRQVAAQAPSVSMSTWLKALVARGNWELELFIWPVAGVEESSFSWGNGPSLENFASRLWQRMEGTPDPAGASIGLPEKGDLSRFPLQIQQYYSLVGEVQWSPPGNAGQIFGSAGLRPVSELSYLASELDPQVAATTYTWGITENGETFVFNEQGNAGWIAVGSDIEITGSVDEMLESIYGGLLEGKTPQREY